MSSPSSISLSRPAESSSSPPPSRPLSPQKVEEVANAVLRDMCFQHSHHPAVQYRLGEMAQDSDNRIEAETWYTQAKSKGYGKAIHRLGDLARLGDDPEKAHELYEEALTKEPNLQLILAFAPSEREKAIEHYRQGALWDHAVCQVKLAFLLLKSRSEAERREATCWFISAALQGNSQALLWLVYIQMAYPEIEDEKTMTLLERAAHLGHREGQFELAKWYINKIRTPQKKVQGFMWCKKAAESGLLDAMRLLGHCFLHGHGTEKDYTKAIEWGEKAANQGDALAQFDLSQWTLEATPQKAKQWLIQSAQNGCKQAQATLGEHYRCGWRQGAVMLLPQDDRLAIHWFTQALNGCDPNNPSDIKSLGPLSYGSAALSLARFYGQGIGVARDLQMAMHYYFISTMENAPPAIWSQESTRAADELNLDNMEDIPELAGLAPDPESEAESESEEEIEENEDMV